MTIVPIRGEKSASMATIRPASQVTSAHLRGWAGGSPSWISGAGAGGVLVVGEPKARSLCLPICCHRSGAARVCKLALILANDVAVDLQEVGRGS